MDQAILKRRVLDLMSMFEWSDQLATCVWKFDDHNLGRYVVTSYDPIDGGCWIDGCSNSTADLERIIRNIDDGWTFMAVFDLDGPTGTQPRIVPIWGTITVEDDEAGEPCWMGIKQGDLSTVLTYPVAAWVYEELGLTDHPNYESEDSDD